MPLSVPAEMRKDYYDLNVAYTSFGWNKTTQTVHSRGRVGGLYDLGGAEKLAYMVEEHVWLQYIMISLACHPEGSHSCPSD